ncbi:MAG: hypothetical protein ACLFVU_08105 [Phycisphaerae bacterium]
MPVDRPTFSESWYRVSELKPRLRSTVQIFRQQFRGQLFHVVQDPGSNQHFRLNEPAYEFVALLDGRRTVGQAWRTASENLGDSAPTQGEAIQLLGQLYASNLLQAELPPDAAGLFKRYQKRVRKEMQGYLMNFLFVRIPLFDPDRVLNFLLPLFGWLFSKVGFALWLIAVGAGLFAIAGHLKQAIDRAPSMFDLAAMPLMFLCFWIVKIFHEFGHALACKKFGRDAGTGGEVHVMGIMLLVFAPLPYVDTSSSWVLRNKWHRVVVGAAGMMIELVIAAIAAIVWVTVPYGLVNSMAYNIMLIASVSTLLFNGNPLLRYDAYYILSDLTEIPNLSQRSKDYIYYLVKRYVWRVRNPRSPAYTWGERVWFLIYGPASMVYRIFILSAILWMITQKLPVVGVGLAAAAVVAWMFVPLGKFLHYLVTGNELARVRPLAVTTSLVVLIGLAAGIALIPLPDDVRIEGVVEPVDLAVVYAQRPGRVAQYVPTDETVSAGQAVVVTTDPELESKWEVLQADLRRLRRERDVARSKGLSKQHEVKAYEAQLRTLGRDLERLRKQRDQLVRRSPIEGLWISPQVDRLDGTLLEDNQTLGLVARLDKLRIRAVAGQDQAAVIREMGRIRDISLRVKGAPELQTHATLEKILPAGQERLPTAVLGYGFGGSIATDPEDPEGLKTEERVHEVRLIPDGSGVKLYPGQRVVVRVKMPTKPLVQQAYIKLLQMLNRSKT